MQANRRLTPYELLWEEALEPLDGFHVPEDAVCDVIMRCGGIDFDVHSEVLAASSPVFNEVIAEYNRVCGGSSTPYPWTTSYFYEFLSFQVPY